MLKPASQVAQRLRPPLIRFGLDGAGTVLDLRLTIMVTNRCTPWSSKSMTV